MGKDVDTSMRRPPESDPDPDAVEQFVSGEGDQDERGDTPDADEVRETDRIGIYFEATTAKKLRMYAAETGRPISRIVDDLVAGELEGWTPEF